MSAETMERLKVYIETTIPSFLTSRPSNKLILAGKQALTRQWWERRREKYDLFISQYVLDEASKGDAEAAERRMNAISHIEMLEVDNDVILLAEKIMQSGIIPPKADTDALHIAVASRHSIDFLLTWNCTHIANAEIFVKINHIVTESGYFLPTICTPDELFGGEDYE
jgi:predicted nucleic acid-binding protein